MRRRWPVLAATVPMALGWATATALPAAGSPAGEPGRPGGIFRGGNVVSSSNWAGYVASGGNGAFTSASAEWTQPAGTCTGGDRYAAFWVGLDGYTSGTVEQVGTEVDCAGRTPRYYAWYEIYPGAAVNLRDRVSPGDKLSGSVTAQAGGRFLLVLKDITKGWKETDSASLSGAALSSAEVIAEAPSAGHRTLPLTSFGTVRFASAAANGKSMATFKPVEITMPDTTVSAMTSAGNFSATYTEPASRGGPADDRTRNGIRWRGQHVQGGVAVEEAGRLEHQSRTA